MNAETRKQLLEEELLLIHHSGELPEVALHSSLHALCESADGPGLQLAEQELRLLHEATLQQYQRILLRDLQADNRKRPIFRGLQRAICNWHRLVCFSAKMNPPVPPDPLPVAHALLGYLRVELEDLQAGCPGGTVNCTAQEFFTFAQELGCAEQLPLAWEEVFS